MTKQFTSRLGLIKPDPGTGEPVAVEDLNTNSNKIDQWAGSLLVNDGVTPATPELFDGAVVVERTSGKAWVAIKNLGGTFDKKWISVPYQHCAFNVGDAFGTVGAYSFRDPLSFSAAWSKNAVEADSGAGGFIVPFSGLWHITTISRWAVNATGNRGILYVINGTSQNNETEMMNPAMSGYDTIQRISMTRPLVAGDAIRTMMFQNSGSTINNYQLRTATLITPSF